MITSEVRRKYLDFFSDKVRKHTVVPSASLVPENDPTTLFTGSGMQPMVPYLLGQKHPLGTRIVDSQKCFRSQDIEEVGDNRHTTFFEMLGNWSLGDYWKKDQLSWIFEFLTKELGINSEKLWVSCFEGDEKFGLPRDNESADIWKKIGVAKERICFYGTKKNWWSRAGAPENMPVGEPGGPDSEVFFDFGAERGLHEKSPWKDEICHPNCDCGRFMEIGNSVFMEYRKIAPRTNLGSEERFVLGAFQKLPQKNVDFGGGLERITAAANDNFDIFTIDVFEAIIVQLERSSGKSYTDNSFKKAFRVVADHVRAAVFLMSDSVSPSNTDRGYFVRRLIRRAVRFGKELGLTEKNYGHIIEAIAEKHSETHSLIRTNMRIVRSEFLTEVKKFNQTLDRGLKEFKKMATASSGITSRDAFLLLTSYGFPVEVTKELARERNIPLHLENFEIEMAEHREISKVGSEKKFKGGLADTSDTSVKYHTATHLLHQALRDVLGKEVRQKGSNITPERLRFDFAFSRKLTDEEKKKVEEIVKEKIKEGLPVQKIVLPFAEAEKTGALHFFGEKYGDRVNVYFIGNSLDTAYSKEFCGGPHVSNTSVIGHFKIVKEEAVSQGVRRIKAIVE